MWKRVADWLALTSTERKVMLFLSLTIVLGVGIRTYRAAFPQAPSFDYRAEDSTFAALSSSLKNEEAESANHHQVADGKLNLNTATKQQLMDLPGIGEVTAERILRYRADNGKFRSVSELRKVKGMTKKKLETLNALLTVDDTEAP